MAKSKIRRKTRHSLEEHQKIIEREQNPERRAFYELCRHLGGSQGDIGRLQADDIDWEDRTVGYQRKKAEVAAILFFGDEVEKYFVHLSQGLGAFEQAD